MFTQAEQVQWKSKKLKRPYGIQRRRRHVVQKRSQRDREPRRRDSEAGMTLNANALFWWHVLREARVPATYFSNEKALRDTRNAIVDICKELGCEFTLEEDCKSKTVEFPSLLSPSTEKKSKTDRAAQAGIKAASEKRAILGGYT
uniref:Uncharacterized protein n=1 Tax=Lotharella oceanica TaxID=641309 RepID=A0A7S2XEA9_9EUKA|mmetsp:Transcript_31627/g.58991  ORF Transcript_31627/g.58991 Transcript_31627/m.58991 type:complete len:145 (+) Transcript_31627:86-520(+)